MSVASNIVMDKAWHESIGSDEKCLSFCVDFDAVEKVDSCQEIVFLNCKMSSENGWLWMFMEMDSVKKGHWISNDEGKPLWSHVVHKRKRVKQDSDQDTCKCQEDCGLKDCVRSGPVESL